MIPRLLLDTHVAVRWLSDPKRLSKEQIRLIREAERQGGAVALSAYSLVEVAMLAQGSRVIGGDAENIFRELDGNLLFRVLPITLSIAREAAGLRSLRDPGDCTIVATARIHNLRLLTSDQRIIDSRLVSVID